MEEMEQSFIDAKIEKTSDIDISFWYHQEIPREAFLDYNRKFKNRIEEVFQSNETKQHIRRLFDRFIPNHEEIDTFDIEVTIEPVPDRFAHKTTIVNVAFIINGKKMKIMDIAIKNALYSQAVKKNFSPITNGMRVQNDPVYSNKSPELTGLLRINTTNVMSVSVRLPTFEAFIEQQLFVYGNKLLRGTTRNTYIKRIMYLLPYVSQNMRQLIQQRVMDLSRASAPQMTPVEPLQVPVPPMAYPPYGYPQMGYPPYGYPAPPVQASPSGLTRNQIRNVITRRRRHGGRITKRSTKNNRRTTQRSQN